MLLVVAPSANIEKEEEGTSKMAVAGSIGLMLSDDDDDDDDDAVVVLTYCLDERWLAAAAELETVNPCTNVTKERQAIATK